MTTTFEGQPFSTKNSTPLFTMFPSHATPGGSVRKPRSQMGFSYTQQAREHAQHSIHQSAISVHQSATNHWTASSDVTPGFAVVTSATSISTRSQWSRTSSCQTTDVTRSTSQQFAHSQSTTSADARCSLPADFQQLVSASNLQYLDDLQLRQQVRDGQTNRQRERP